MKIKRKNAKGQAIVEYILIIAIVAVASMVVLGMFSDRLRNLIGGVVNSFDNNTPASTVSSGDSVNVVKSLSPDNTPTSGN